MACEDALSSGRQWAASGQDPPGEPGRWEQGAEVTLLCAGPALGALHLFS